MGVVRFAIGFPHIFYVVAAPILFLGITAGIKMPAEILHTSGPHDEERSVLKDRFLPDGARLDRRLPHRSALLSNGRRCSLSSPRRMRRRKSIGTSPPTSRKRKWSISRSRSA
jgi:hypothetical protein